MSTHRPAARVLRQGRNREPLRLCSLPDDPQVRLKMIY
jgi:hypothetical protein